MNLREKILEEHSKEQAKRLVKWIGTDKKRFAELLKLFLNDEYRVTQRAGWPLSDCAQLHPELVKPHTGRLIRHLDKTGQHDAVHRNIFRILQVVDVPSTHMGPLVDRCIAFLLKHETPIAIKAFAITVLGNLAKKEPELQREVKVIFDELLREEIVTPAIRVRVRDALKVMSS